MASNYGYNFGFRRSDEDVRTSEGGYKTPVGSALLIGTAVEIDFSSAGFLKASANTATLRKGIAGLLVQELAEFRSIYETNIVDSSLLGITKPNRLAVITAGTGMKVWFKNTASVTRVDGHVVPAVTIVDLTSVTDGGLLGWDGSKWVNTATASQAWFTVLSHTTTSVEAVMI